MFEEFCSMVREHYGVDTSPIPLHAPVFKGREREYVLETIDSSFVSSVGPFVDRLEGMVQDFTGAKRAVATVNGTAALHAALHVLGVTRGDLVITQPLTFVATGNAIKYTGANPVFIDVDGDTMGMSPLALESFLRQDCRYEGGVLRHVKTGAHIAACVPMHTFGFPCRIKEILQICDEFDIPVIEDAAESLGSSVGSRHTGLFGRIGTLSFNGNKTVTAGGGGALLCDDEDLASRLKHITTTAKMPHRWEYDHDELGFNYRMPNLNAALACAQFEMLPRFLEEKRQLADKYQRFFSALPARIVPELPGTTSNYWLNTVIMPDKETRDHFLEYTNNNGVMTRPAWRLIHQLPAFRDCQAYQLENAIWLQDRIVNIPSGVRG